MAQTNYYIEDSDSKANGTIGNGHARTNVTPGERTVMVPAFGAARWSKRSADFQDTVTMEIECLNMKDGETIVFHVLQIVNSPWPKKISTCKESVSGGMASIEWKLPDEWWEKNKKTLGKVETKFVFRCNWHNQEKEIDLKSEFSDELTLTATLKIALYDEKKKAISKEPFKIYFSNNQVKLGTTDASGKAKIEKLPICNPQIMFPNSTFICPSEPCKISSIFDKQKKFQVDLTKENEFYVGLAVKCKHKIDGDYRLVMNPSEYQVVQDAPELKGFHREEDQEIVYIHTYSANKLTEKSGAALKEGNDGDGIKTYSLEVAHKGHHESMEFYRPRFWKELLQPTEYSVTDPNSSLAIKAYCPDQYALSISFPPPKPFKAGAKWSEDNLEDIEDKSVVTKKLQQRGFRYVNEENRNKEKERGNKQWGTIHKWYGIFSQERPVEFKVNDKSVEISAIDAFGSVILLLKKINSIVDCIKQNLPKAGGYFEFKNEALKGKFILNWGWREYDDHRAFMAVGVSMEMTLLSVEFEIGVGISIFQVVGQVYGVLAGSVTISINAERSSPDNALSIEVPFGASIEANLGARVKASVLIHIEAKFASALELTAGKVMISADDPLFSIEGELKWTGIKAIVTISVGPGKSGGKKKKDTRPLEAQSTALKGEGDCIVLVKEKELGKFKIPSEEKVADSTMSIVEIKDIFNEELCKVGSFKFEDTNAIDKIVSYIENRNDLDKGEGKIRCAAIASRKHLKDMSEKGKNITNGNLIAFCNELLGSILDGIRDPTFEIKEAMLKKP